MFFMLFLRGSLAHNHGNRMRGRLGRGRRTSGTGHGPTARLGAFGAGRRKLKAEESPGQDAVVSCGLPEEDTCPPNFPALYQVGARMQRRSCGFGKVGWTGTSQ